VNFSDEQLRAIDLGRLGQDACIVAGPGSGKTAVLVERYRQLITNTGLDPSRILVITFTEKAAANMKKRIVAIVDEADRLKVQEAPIHTVDAFCARLLRENAVLAGIDPGFAILDDRRVQIERQGSASEALNQLLTERREEMLELADTFAGSNLSACLDEAYEAIRSSGVPLAKLREQPEIPDLNFRAILALIAEYEKESMAAKSSAQMVQRAKVLRLKAALEKARDASILFDVETDFGTAKISDRCRALVAQLKAAIATARSFLISHDTKNRRMLLADILLRLDNIYTARKRELSALDFADLVALTVQLLEAHPPVRERLGRQYEQIFMDEFQDTNEVQDRLLRLLRSSNNFFAVGDVNQSIFGFRHALPQVFHDYRKSVQERGHHLHELEENWRSRAEILRAAELITHGTPGIETRPLHARRAFEEKPCPSVDVLIADVKEGRDELEADLVAQRILELHRTLRIREGGTTRAAQFKDFAILLRSAENHIARFAEALDRIGVPHLLTRRANFFSEREVVDLRRVLATIANPLDELSLAAVLRSPLVFASDEALFILKQHGSLAAGLMQLDEHSPGLLGPDDWRNLLAFRSNLNAWRAAQPFLDPERLLLRVMDDSGFPFLPATQRGAKIEKFLSIVRSLGQDMSLRELCDLMDNIDRDNAREQDAPLDEKADCVRLLTAHASKGLEFPVVVIPAMERGAASGVPELLFSPQFGIGAKWRVPGTLSESCSDHVHAQIAAHVRARDTEETHRLLYVALTRAEDHLVLSWCGSGSKEWASVVKQQLDIDCVETKDTPQVVACASPYGQPFSVRVLRATRMPGDQAIFYSDASPSEPEFLDPPELTGQHDTTASVTSLTQFAVCPRKYYLSRYLGLEAARRSIPASAFDEDEDDDVEPRLDAGELGTQVHQLLAGLPVPGADLRALAMAQTFEASSLNQRAKRARRVEREYEFLLAIDDVIVSGTIDLWFQDSREVTIVDYKTDDVSASEAVGRVRDYATQLRLYALALERETGHRPSHAYLHFLRPDVVIDCNLQGDLEAEALQAVAALSAAQALSDFPLHQAAHCHRCSFYRGPCPAGTGRPSEGHVQTLAVLT
jgi:ATP-dependent helicase/nuclease subunit A